ncbi:MAG TPA: hypothetical protein VGZ52_01460 [Acidimicrobiales bacterium]|nr:hypothetical protein [Acidimicrobiales bacterium]
MLAPLAFPLAKTHVDRSLNGGLTNVSATARVTFRRAGSRGAQVSHCLWRDAARRRIRQRTVPASTAHCFLGQTNGVGHSEVTFGIGRPTVGYTVVVDVNVGGQASCSTSFTPQYDGHDATTSIRHPSGAGCCSWRRPDVYPASGGTDFCERVDDGRMALEAPGASALTRRRS